MHHLAGTVGSIFLVAVTITITGCAHQPRLEAAYDAGVTAYQKGDCDSAYRELWSAALKGDSRALVSVQFMNKACCKVQPPSQADEETETEQLICKAMNAGNASAKLMVEIARGFGGTVCGQPPTNDLQGIQDAALAAAEQGDPNAMDALGKGYENVSGRIDLVRAYAWYALATRRGSTETDSTERVAVHLAADELSRAKQLADQLDHRIPRAKMLRSSCSPR